MWGSDERPGSTWECRACRGDFKASRMDERSSEKQRKRAWNGGAENRQQLGGGIPEGKGDQLLC